MTTTSGVLKTLLIEEVPEAAEIIKGKEDILEALVQSYGTPKEIRSSRIDKEVVFELPEKKLGIILDGETADITGLAIYRGEIPEEFIAKQAAPCVNGYVRTSTVTTTSPTIFVTVIPSLQKAANLAALAMSNLFTHAGNVRTAKTAACAACAPPCTCSAVTLAGAGSAAYAYTPVSTVFGIAVSWNVVHVITTQIRATCT